MGRKIRVTESELVEMIENIISTSKKEKNVIKLSEGDLNKIIKKVNEKIYNYININFVNSLRNFGNR